MTRTGGSGIGAPGYKRAKADNYPTPESVTLALLRTVPLSAAIWEPACGDGAISKVLRVHGRDVTSTDIRHTGYGRGGLDFLKTKKLRAPIVLTNPPFKLWDEFAHHALALGARQVILLGRFLLLEGWARHDTLFKNHLESVVLVGRAKLRPPRTKDKGKSPLVCFAWFEIRQTPLVSLAPRIYWAKP